MASATYQRKHDFCPAARQVHGVYLEDVKLEKYDAAFEAINDRDVFAIAKLSPTVTEDEIRKVRRKMDFRLPPFLLLLYVVTWLTHDQRSAARNKHGHFGMHDLPRSLVDWRTCVNTVIFMTQNLSTYTIATFTLLIVKTFGYDTVKVRLMVAPPFCVAFVCVYLVAHISDRVRIRARIYAVHCAIACIGYLMLALIPVDHPAPRYGALFLIHPAIDSSCYSCWGSVGTR